MTTQLDLWRNNRRGAHWQIDGDELADRFLDSPCADAEMRANRALAGLIADKDAGLSSGWEDTDAFDAALASIRQQRREPNL